MNTQKSFLSILFFIWISSIALALYFDKQIHTSEQDTSTLNSSTPQIVALH